MAMSGISSFVVALDLFPNFAILRATFRQPQSGEMLMFSRAALLLWAQLLCALLLAGCQNAPNQLSLYAPFGSPVVQPPSLTRVNALPYYPDNDKTGTNTAPTTANATNKDLSHYDPYRGIMLPGNFTPPPVLARSTETWGNNDSLVAASRPRERASNEEPIRIIESNNSPTNITAIASQGSGSRSGAVKFNASPPSGAVLPGSTLLATPTKPKTVNAVEMARLPKTTTATSAPPAPATTPAVNTPAVPAFLNPTSAPLTTPPAASQPGLLPPPPLTTPVTPSPVGSNRVSSSDEPRDGNVMRAAHFEEVDPSAWRVKR